MQTTYSVPGMSCDHCRTAITNGVCRIPGVTGVHVDLRTKQVAVDGAFDDGAVRSAIDVAGYDIA